MLESNELDVPFPSLPPANDCMPCIVFVPFYANCIVGQREKALIRNFHTVRSETVLSLRI